MRALLIAVAVSMVGGFVLPSEETLGNSLAHAADGPMAFGAVVGSLWGAVGLLTVNNRRTPLASDVDEDTDEPQHEVPRVHCSPSSLSL